LNETLKQYSALLVGQVQEENPSPLEAVKVEADEICSVDIVIGMVILA